MQYTVRMSGNGPVGAGLSVSAKATEKRTVPVKAPRHPLTLRA